MSDDENVWSPGDEGRPPAPVPPAGTAYGEGLWINQAFSLDVAFRLGLALLRERPGLMLGVGALVWFLTNLPTLLSLPGDFVVGWLQATGDMGTADVVDLGNNLMSIATTLVAFPFIWFVTTGALRAVAQVVETDRLDATVLWSSYGQASWVILYRILSAFVLGAAMLVGLAPAIGVAGAFIAFGDWESGLILGLALSSGVIVLVWVVVGLPLALGPLACAIDGVNAMEAFPIAWKAGQGARATLFVFALVFGVLWLVGACVFCVGQIPVYALMMGAAGGGWVLYARPEQTVQRSPFLQRNLPDLT